MKPPPQSKILMIGNDSSLTYLIGRYAEQGGYQITSLETLPTSEEVRALRPSAILFPTLDTLEKAQRLIADLLDWDIPILVCSSVADEPRARELGADLCLLHPMTYDRFRAALAGTKTSKIP